MILIPLSRQYVDPLAPWRHEPGVIMLEDIAHSLSQQCRYTGHSFVSWSVGEHSILVSELLRERHPGDPALALAGLLHDAAETYLGDFSSPMKSRLLAQTPHGVVSVSEIEREWLRLIARRFGISCELFSHPSLQEIDGRICADEMNLLLGGCDLGIEPLGVEDRIRAMCEFPRSPEEIRDRFSREFSVLVNEIAEEPEVSGVPEVA